MHDPSDVGLLLICLGLLVGVLVFLQLWRPK